MTKPISDQLFSFKDRDVPQPTRVRCSAKDLGLRESWLRDAIFALPELVIGPCRSAGLTEDEWYPWQREFRVDVGAIDVLLLSSQGRIAIVETKLASNPELRRSVLAQALDYLAHLAERFDESMPAIPMDEETGEPVAEREDILEAVSQGDILVIIASDEADPRVAKLSRNLLSDHLTKQWDLAVVDLALYRSEDKQADELLVVPHVRAMVESEPRQVVRIVVEGEKPSARIEVQRVTRETGSSARQKWDEERFLANLKAEKVPSTVCELASNVRDLARNSPESLTIAWGTGKEGSMTLKRHDGGLIELYASGKIKFRPAKFARALGEEAALKYQRGLEQMLPDAMKMGYPRLSPTQAEKVAPALYRLIRETVSGIEGNA